MRSPNIPKPRRGLSTNSTTGAFTRSRDAISNANPNPNPHRKGYYKYCFKGQFVRLSVFHNVSFTKKSWLGTPPAPVIDFMTRWWWSVWNPLQRTLLADYLMSYRFLPDKESVDRVRRTFTGLYTLDPVMYISSQFSAQLYDISFCESEGLCHEILRMPWSSHYRGSGTKKVYWP